MFFGLALSVVGLAIYRYFSSDLEAAIARGLRSRSNLVAAVVSQGEPYLDALERVSDEQVSFAQVLAPTGAVLATTHLAAGGPVLPTSAIQRALHGKVFLERGPIGRIGSNSRLLARPARLGGRGVVVVVGTVLRVPEEELSRLTILLIFGGLVALGLGSLASYGVAALALRPVDAMRRRAAEIDAGDAHTRLPVPPSNDELSRLGLTLNEMLGRLSDAFERERLFVANASHQLRSPLAILKAEIELALMRERSPEELRAALLSAGSEADRLEHLASELLDLAVLDQQGAPKDVERVAARTLLEGVAARAAPTARRLGVEMVVVAEPGPGVIAERIRVEQALENMLDNALRAARHEVRLRGTTDGRRVELHVEDDGPGFDESIRERAFEPFARGRGEEASAGTGLGLAIVAAIAANHKGSAALANLPGGGADVWLELAAAPPLAASGEKARQPA